MFIMKKRNCKSQYFLCKRKFLTVLFISVQYSVSRVATNIFIQKRILDCEKENDSTLEFFSLKQKIMHKNELTDKLKFQKLSEIKEILLLHNHLRFIILYILQHISCQYLLSVFSINLIVYSIYKHYYSFEIYIQKLQSRHKVLSSKFKFQILTSVGFLIFQFSSLNFFPHNRCWIRNQ